eukprot:COSAG05_NODE_1947_length_3795_cov_6.551677_2_plen_53_part_00
MGWLVGVGESVYTFDTLLMVTNYVACADSILDGALSSSLSPYFAINPAQQVC